MTDFESNLRNLVRDVVREEIAAASRAPQSEYLTTRAAAELARVTTGTIQRWVSDGKLAEHRAGRVLRVLRSDLESFLAGGTRARRERITPDEALARAAARIR